MVNSLEKITKEELEQKIDHIQRAVDAGNVIYPELRKSLGDVFVAYQVEYMRRYKDFHGKQKMYGNRTKRDSPTKP